MPEPSLIGDYLAALAAQLPAPIVAELADGLDQTPSITSTGAWARTPRARPRWPSSASRR